MFIAYTPMIGNNQPGFFRVYVTKYGMGQFVALIIFGIIACLFVFFTGKSVYKRTKEYNKLQKEGVLTTAYVSRTAIGGGRMGANFVYYQFYDLSNRLAEKKEEVGRRLNWKSLKTIKKGDKIQIRFLENDPSICQIVNNVGPIRTRMLFLVFFILMLLVIITVIFFQGVRTIGVTRLYKHGIVTKGIILSKKVKATQRGIYGVDISYQFMDNRGKVHVSKEKIRRVELANDLVKGATVMVFYKKDNPAKSTICTST